jgi:beta-glucosidase/6-phospho-beta-glucosidase/beta-galactosidase
MEFVESSQKTNKRVEQLKTIQANALELFTRKNIDYGDAFAKFGIIGVLMRIEDKIQRSLTITKNGVQMVNDESMRDTLLDLHNYAAMALMLIDEDIVEK